MLTNSQYVINKIIKIYLSCRVVMRNRIICKECHLELETRSERSMKKCEGCQLQ